MKKILKTVFNTSLMVGGSLLMTHEARAMTGPTAIQIDGGPLGALQLSGGADGYAYYNNPVVSGQNNGVNVGSALVELQKTTGILQFTIEIGSIGGGINLGSNSPGVALGKISQTSITLFPTGPLYVGYLTLAPTGSPITISAGHLFSLEGYESFTDWSNFSQLTTAIAGVENGNNRGFNVNYTSGPVNATVQFGDGWDDGVFNFLQVLANYTINSNDAASVYYAGSLGRTGLNAITYGNTAESAYGAYYKNSQMIGGYYNYTVGNLNLIPEVQYVYAKADANLGLAKGSANFGAVLFGDYSFGTSPYSVSGWAEYSDSTGPDAWYVGPKAELVGLAVSPTWQYKDLFARANFGVAYLLNNKADGVSYAYGSKNDNKLSEDVTLEGGLLF